MQQSTERCNWANAFRLQGRWLVQHNACNMRGEEAGINLRLLCMFSCLHLCSARPYVGRGGFDGGSVTHCILRWAEPCSFRLFFLKYINACPSINHSFVVQMAKRRKRIFPPLPLPPKNALCTHKYFLPCCKLPSKQWAQYLPKKIASVPTS